MQIQSKFLKKQKFKRNVNFALKKRKNINKNLNADLSLCAILSVATQRVARRGHSKKIHIVILSRRRKIHRV